MTLPFIYFFSYKFGIAYRYHIVEAYLALGGIPYYWNAFEAGCSAAQNIARLFFSEIGLLKEEFQNLFASLFKNPESHVAVIEGWAQKPRWTILCVLACCS